MIPEYTPIILNVNGFIIIKQVGELLNGKYCSKVEERNNKTIEYYDLELFNIKLWSDYDFTRLIGIKKVFFGNLQSNQSNSNHENKNSQKISSPIEIDSHHSKKNSPSYYNTSTRN